MPPWPCVTSISRRVGNQSMTPKPVMVMPPVDGSCRSFSRSAIDPDSFRFAERALASGANDTIFLSGLPNNAITREILLDVDRASRAGSMVDSQARSSTFYYVLVIGVVQA